MIFVGDDWAEAHHDVYMCDDAGARLAARRLPEGIEGATTLHGLIADLADDPSEVVVGIETDRGLWVPSLIEAGYAVYAINPRSASRYRERHSLSGAKSDRADAKMLAELVRLDRHNHRPVSRIGGSQGPHSSASEPDLGTHPPHQPAPQRVTRVLPGRVGDP